ncbi:hypothetical protein B0T44_09325 [Nocardia donostiensis]|uniref:Uncharacterized protein n=1 Tax=Nocardia donostiensis TaxID=1538463 RepID=A0A1V2TLZ3_9NOCA|nr:hypothetical protein B0T46_01140 [Nocardia donostiensis]OQS20808.1 hypothetical protein B0T44_09325 [Nocardia donostiensis]
MVAVRGGRSGVLALERGIARDLALVRGLAGRRLVGQRRWWREVGALSEAGRCFLWRFRLGGASRAERTETVGRLARLPYRQVRQRVFAAVLRSGGWGRCLEAASWPTSARTALIRIVLELVGRDRRVRLLGRSWRKRFRGAGLPSTALTEPPVGGRAARVLLRRIRGFGPRRTPMIVGTRATALVLVRQQFADAILQGQFVALVALVTASALAALLLARAGVGAVVFGATPFEKALLGCGSCGSFLDEFFVGKVLYRSFVTDVDLAGLGDVTLGQPWWQHGEAVVVTAHTSPSWSAWPRA